MQDTLPENTEGPGVCVRGQFGKGSRFSHIPLFLRANARNDTTNTRATSDTTDTLDTLDTTDTNLFGSPRGPRCGRCVLCRCREVSG